MLDLDPVTSKTRSDFAGYRFGKPRVLTWFCRIEILYNPDLDPFWPDPDPSSGSKDIIMDPFMPFGL